MKKIILKLICLLVLLPSLSVVNAQTDSQLLQKKLSKFNTLNANFSQQVMNPKGKVIQESWGKLTIARPGNFHWEVTSPDDELIVSNGKDVWLYSPFIEQVTIMNFSDAIDGTPFVLLSGANAAQWAKFNVVANNNRFTVTHVDATVHSSKFVFVFDNVGKISEFVVRDEYGQKSVFTLSVNERAPRFPDNYFEFSIPTGTEVDDQR